MINDVARDVMERFAVDLFVETGLYNGETIGIVRRWFPKLNMVPIELDMERVMIAKRKWPDVFFVQGSSELVLKRLIDDGRLLEPKLPFFYLDAHWNEYVPLLDEIEQVLRTKCAVLAIDDFDQEGALPAWSFEQGGKKYTLDAGFLRDRIPADRAKAVYRPIKPNAHGVGMCFVFLDWDDEEVQQSVEGLPLTRNEL